MSPSKTPGDGQSKVIALLVLALFVVTVLYLREHGLRRQAEAVRASGSSSSSSVDEEPPKHASATKPKHPPAKSGDDEPPAKPKKPDAQKKPELAAGEAVDFRMHGAMQLVDLDDDGGEDVLGAVLVNSGDDVAAIDGESFRVRWRFPGNGYVGSRHLRAVGRHVVFVDEAGVLHVLALTDGTEELTQQLSDKCEHIAGAPTGDQAWIRTTDEKGVLVDLAGAKVSPAPAPTWDAVDRFCEAPHGACFRDFIDKHGPPIPEVDPRETLLVDGLGFVIGVHSPGSPTPYLARFNPKSKKVEWRVEVPEPEDRLAATFPSSLGGAEVDEHGGTICALYGIGFAVESPHVACFDVEGGTKRWDVALAARSATFGRLATGEKRVYVSVDTKLIVLSLSEGSMIQKVGG